MHAFLLLALSLPTPFAPQDAALSAALARADRNAEVLQRALETAPAEQRADLAHLIRGMPESDLRSLSAEFLLAEVAAACAAREAAPWGSRIPDEVFRNAVLPYAHVTETRESWRADLRARCLPMIEGCTSPGEAARRINERLFAAVNVRYATTRRRADQSPSESIAQGVASCTGLSILLANACRSVGVPARLAGIAEWPDKRGNHTWVEVWDDDGWHFVGAAEPDPAGLDRAWFVGDAARAIPGDPRHGIWALTFEPTGTRFPLVWARGEGAWAVDVTARYRPQDGVANAPRLAIDVRDGDGGPRVPAEVELLEVHDDGRTTNLARGIARDERADTNDHLEFTATKGAAVLRIRFGTRRIERSLAAADAARRSEVIELPPGAAGEAAFRAGATAYFADTSPGRDAAAAFEPAADAFVGAHEAEARSIAFALWRAAPGHDELRADFGSKLVRTADRQSAYTVKTVGERGPQGYALVIAMHGGGGVPPAVNDSQWRHMQVYYREHPEAGGYHYVALRAPNDAWNGFYDDAIAPLVERLIRQFVLFGDVDPDRVVAIGYSHGGYGAFVLGPKLPDRFAAVHASASAPTDGETQALNLRNLRFSFMVGEKDTAYGRLDRCNAFDAAIRALRDADAGGYPVSYSMIAGNGHTGLPDRDLLAQLVPLVRDAAPAALAWQTTDAVLAEQHWLRMLQPADGRRLLARFTGERLVVEAKDVGPLSIGLDRRLLGERLELTIEREGETRRVRYAPSAATLCEDLARRGDPALAFPMRVGF